MATNDKTQAHVKGRNVEPMSSVLKVETRDVDVSGLTLAPVDGEWLVCSGGIGGTADRTYTAAGIRGGGALLKMVWSHKDRSDLQSTGRRRVPVVWMHPLHCKLHLYNFIGSKSPIAGDWVMVLAAKEAVDGDTDKDRLVANVQGGGTEIGAQTAGWCVGVVLKTPASNPVTGGGASGPSVPLEVMLYDQPRWVSAQDLV